MTKVLPEVQEAHAPQGVACGVREHYSITSLCESDIFVGDFTELPEFEVWVHNWPCFSGLL